MPSPVSYKIVASENIVIHTVLSGHSSEEFIACIQERMKDPDYNTKMDIIWFFGEGSKPLEMSQSRRVLGMASFFFPDRGSYRVALVSEDDSVFGSLRQFASLASPLQSTHKAFREMDAALAWIKECQNELPPE